MKRLNLLSGILMAIAMTPYHSVHVPTTTIQPPPRIQTRNRNFPIITLIFL